MQGKRNAGCGPVAITVGEVPPAMSISWEKPKKRWDSGYLVFFSEFNPDRDDDPTPTLLVCLHCLLEDGDEQLSHGLELAREHGQVDWDPNHGAWTVPVDQAWAQP